jgi:PAS domain S-box-containing protein
MTIQTTRTIPTAPGTPQRVDPFDALLAHATLMIDSQGCVLDLAPQRGAPEGIILGWGMPQSDARQFVHWLRGKLDREARGPYAIVPVPAEQWPTSLARLGAPNDGEAVAIHLADGNGSLGWMACVGITGMASRLPLASPRQRAAFIGQLVAQVRATLEARALREQRDQLDSVFRFSGDGILTVDATLRITSCNPALESLIDRRAGEMLGRFYYDVLRTEDLQGEPLGLARCPLLEAFATGTPVVAREIAIHARDGQRLNVAVTAAAVYSDEGQVASGVLNVRDVSHQHAQEVLASNVVSVVSHELQTPIAIIKGYASTLGRPEAMRDPVALRQRLGAIEEEADRLSHMVSNLLYASRIQAGGLSMDPAPLDVGEVLASCVRRFRARGVRHELRLRCPDNLPLVLADRERIEEVVANLLDNAIKYAPQSRSIRIQGHFTGEAMIVSIRDNGPGIPLREQARVFDRFERIDGDLTRRASGAGLGLYICQAIVRAHGGQIWVESEVGVGSTFSFSLPRMERAAVPMVIGGSK